MLKEGSDQRLNIGPDGAQQEWVFHKFEHSVFEIWAKFDVWEEFCMQSAPLVI